MRRKDEDAVSVVLANPDRVVADRAGIKTPLTYGSCDSNRARRNPVGVGRIAIWCPKVAEYGNLGL